MKRTRKRIAILVDIAVSLFQEEPKTGIDKYLKEADIDAVFFGIGDLNAVNVESRAKMNFFSFLSPHYFDGVLIISTSLVNRKEGVEALKRELEKLNPMPIVSIGPSITGEEHFTYNKAGMSLLMKHLIKEHAFSRFAYISGPLSNSESKDRLEIFRSELDAAGIPHSEEHEYEGNFLPTSGSQAVQAFLDERKLKPDVIVCGNDLMATGAWEAIRDRNLIVPYDIALTGYDDLQVAGTLSHQLTSVRQSFIDLGYTATKRLHEKIQGKEKSANPVLEPKLIVRGSCGCIEFFDRDSESKNRRNSQYLDETKNLLSSYFDNASDESSKKQLFNKWIEIIQRAVSEKQPGYEFEQLLREMENNAQKSEERDYRIFSTLHTLLTEGYSQGYFSKYWKSTFFTEWLRINVDRLQNAMINDIRFSQHKQLFLNLVQVCQARSFHIVRFNDFSDASKGESMVFSTSDIMEGKMKAPEGAHWLPEEPGTYVANIITNDQDTFGYFLIDATIPIQSIFDTLRVRFSSISRDLLTMTSVKQLNEELSVEVREREKTELKLKQALMKVEQLSVQDALTGLKNRRGFITSAEQQIKYLRRHKKTYAILFADLDGLKTINDIHGHKEGDIAIQAAAEVLLDVLRDSDIIGRLGGDEFTAMVNVAEPHDLDVIVERLHEKCSEKSKRLNKPWHLNMSIGSCIAQPGNTDTLDELIEAADFELYKQKKQKKKGYSP